MAACSPEPRLAPEFIRLLEVWPRDPRLAKLGVAGRAVGWLKGPPTGRGGR